MSSELRWCPWCGSKDVEAIPCGIRISKERKVVELHHSACFGCGVSGPKADTEAEAIAAWNTRAPMELSDRDWLALYVEMKDSLKYEMGEVETIVAKAARNWWAERSGG